ncbi:MAG: 30S ribosome-binding factor RbfA [Patescibacteria group bacterium]|jgi:ribosome-binding factor A
MPAGRMEKVNALIAQELAQAFQHDVEFPKGTVVSIMEVMTSRDLRHAQVHLSILPEAKTEEVLDALIEAKSDLEDSLHRRLIMKYTPRLAYRLDHSMARQEHIDVLLDRLKSEE